MTRLSAVLATIIVTWDVVTYGPEKEVKHTNQYTGITYTSKERQLDQRRPMVKTFNTKDEAIKFLNGAANADIPIFEKDFKYNKTAYIIPFIGDDYWLDNFVVKDENTVYYDGRQKR